MNDVKNIPITDIADFESVDVVEVLVKAGDEVAIELWDHEGNVRFHAEQVGPDVGR